MEFYGSLSTLFRHNLWANLRLLESCGELTDAQMAARIPGSQGSIRETLEHIALAERSYHSRVSTGEPYRRPENARAMNIGEMETSLRMTGEGLIEWALKVNEEDVVQLDWDGTPREVPKTIVLAQVINHATEHREQVKAVMTDLGLQPPDLQSWAFFDEMDKRG